MVKVFIIVLNWNRPKDTLECLESINKLIAKNFKLSVIVVDNASSDDSVKILKSYKLKNGKYKLIVNDDNLGYVGGNNRGMMYAVKHRADYILILNNDTVVDNKLIQSFLENNDKRIGIVSPKIYFAKGFEFYKKKYKKRELNKVIWYAGGEMDWDNVFGKNRGVDEVDTGQYDEKTEIDFATGTCMFISSELVKDIGYFDEKFFMYFEDDDFSYRAKEAGWKIIYEPNAILWHKVAQSSKIGSDLNDYFITRNRLLFGMRYASWRTRFALYRESLNHLLYGRKWQKQGVIDFYFANFGKGNWKDD